MGAFPQAVGSGLPILCVAVTFGAQIVDLFHSGDIAGMGAGLVDDLPQLLGILQHGAGTQVVVVEGLPVVVGHEQGGAQGLQQGLFPDVGVGVVNEHAGGRSRHWR